MSPRPQAFTDDELLDAAAATVDDLGPTRLTLADVAERTGASPATLVKRFGSKKGLLAALSARGADALPEVFARARARRQQPLEALVEALSELAAGIRTHQQMAHHVAFLLMDLSDPDLLARARDFAAGLRTAVGGLLAEAADTGDLRCEDLAGLTAAVVTAYHGTMIAWAIEPEGVPAQRLGERLRFTLAPYRTTP
ncbi:TetR/AcrR family transcriptional regulator [Saccharopolyspora erythraea]|uniref:TetR/AcrR family transcriptional regulator n=1 Tax=Saccharopolyspora erythraea TaxID=1836 RepID=UPI001BA65663|nr:TetR/AcrR family transcriptional regulator [Saccharopolyspora erythraea]QUH02820.1 TetR/AcrR family transcriptional regulator [Saccharopolyspora erythraea]